MSATTIHSTLHAQASTTKARFLAPGTHQRADAKGKGKGQGASPAKGPTKTTKARATEAAASAEDEACAAGDLVLISLSRLVPSAFNVRKSGGEDVGELAALIKAQGLLQNLVVGSRGCRRTEGCWVGWQQWGSSPGRHVEGRERYLSSITTAGLRSRWRGGRSCCGASD